MTDTPVLKAEHLGISFGGLKAVSDFDIQIGQNELVGLIGPNGAGKTTIFNLLTGVYQPTEGVIYLNGKSMAKKKPNQMVKEGIARTFQNIRLFKELSVLDNVKVAFNQGMSYSVLKSIFRTPSYWKEEAEIDRKAARIAWQFFTWKTKQILLHRTCLMVSSANWKLQGLLRPIQNFYCWMNQQRA